jgi:hypothetical protein
MHGFGENRHGYELVLEMSGQLLSLSVCKFLTTSTFNMKSNFLSFSIVALIVTGFALAVGCTKNTNPQPSKTDTVTVTKTDTLYGTQTDTTVKLTSGLLLYLPFSGNIADSSGNGNPTQAINGNVLGYDGHGYANSAFASNGSGPTVLVTNNGSIQFDTAYTVSVDFMTLDTTSLHCYVAMIDWTNGEAPSWEIGQTQPSFLSHIDVGANDTALGCTGSGAGVPTNVNDTTNFVVQPSRWYNALFTFHRDTVNTYINGSLIGSKVGTGHIANLCPSAQIVIGNWWDGPPGENVNGALDNVRLYNRVLNAHEIAALAANYQVTSNSVKTAPGIATPARLH